MSEAPRASLSRALLDPRHHRRLLVALAAVILLARIGRGALANYDDCYYAEKAREMLAGGDWLTPHFCGVARFDNPPLFLWMIAALFRACGPCDWAAILPSALAGVATIALLHRLARRLDLGAFGAWTAPVVLLGTGYWLKYAGHAMFDVFLAMLFVAGLLAYRAAWEGRLRAWVALGLVTGLGVLTKSVLGLFPLLVALAHLAWSGRRRVLFGPGPALAAGVAAIVVAPWFAVMLARHHGAFLDEHVGWLLVRRGFVDGRDAQTLARRLQYVVEIGQTYWPWLPAALAGAWIAARRAFARGTAAPGAPVWDARASARLMLLAPVVVVGVMSLGNEKKLWYVMDAFPALALLAALAIESWVTREDVRARIVRGGFALLALVGAVLALTPWGLPAPRRPDLQAVAHAARTLVPEHDIVLMPAGNYWAVANQFVYYSRRALDPPPADSAAVRRALASGRWLLLEEAPRAAFIGADSLAYPVVVRSGAWSLVHAGPRPAVVLEPANTSP